MFKKADLHSLQKYPVKFKEKNNADMVAKNSA